MPHVRIWNLELVKNLSMGVTILESYAYCCNLMPANSVSSLFSRQYDSWTTVLGTILLVEISFDGRKYTPSRAILHKAVLFANVAWLTWGR